MKKSESIVELAEALSKFQGATVNIFKGKAGHGYKYADLAAILDMTRSALAENGLSVIQMPCDAAPNWVSVETMIAHKSGQWVEQSYSMPIPVNKRNSDAQNLGSAVTYARRYAIAAALGIAQTDSDASERINDAPAQPVNIQPVKQFAYSDKDFKKNIGKWRSLIAGGNHTPQSLMTMFEAKGATFTDQQKQELSNGVQAA